MFNFRDFKNKTVNQHVILYYVSSRLFTVPGSDYPSISSSEQETNIPKLNKTKQQRSSLKRGSFKELVWASLCFVQGRLLCLKKYFSVPFTSSNAELFTIQIPPLIYVAFATY